METVRCAGSTVSLAGCWQHTTIWHIPRRVNANLRGSLWQLLTRGDARHQRETATSRWVASRKEVCLLEGENKLASSTQSDAEVIDNGSERIKSLSPRGKWICLNTHTRPCCAAKAVVCIVQCVTICYINTHHKCVITAVITVTNISLGHFKYFDWQQRWPLIVGDIYFVKSAIQG